MGKPSTPHAPSAQVGHGPAEESESERLDRNFSDLLQELRVTQTGVQILFAFLLTLPFAARFGDVDRFERAVYIIALMAAAAAAGMIIAPVAYHRALFRKGRKPELVRSAHRMASGGLAFLLLAIVCGILLVVDVVLDRAMAILLAALAAAWLVMLWGVLPWLRRRSDHVEDLSDLEAAASSARRSA